jgi:zinc transporter ZupT
VTLIYYKALAALLIFSISMAIAIYPLRRQRTFKPTETLELGEALASGIFLGAAFFHMLPDAIQLFNKLYDPLAYPLPEIICVMGFLLLLFLERLSFTHSTIQPSKNSIPYVVALILIIHAVTEGTAMGIGKSFSETLMLFIAIIAHKGSETFALCIILLKHQLPFKRVFLIVVFFSLMTPLGISLGTAINQFAYAREDMLIAAVFNAFAAGTFLYISTLHHIHFHQHEKDTQGLLEFASLAAGAGAMALIALWT